MRANEKPLPWQTVLTKNQPLAVLGVFSEIDPGSIAKWLTILTASCGRESCLFLRGLGPPDVQMHFTVFFSWFRVLFGRRGIFPFGRFRALLHKSLSSLPHAKIEGKRRSPEKAI